MKEYPKRPDPYMCECGHDKFKHGTIWIFFGWLAKNKECEICMCPKFNSIVKPLNGDVSHG